MIACDFLTVETIRLKTLYVLFFIELQTRRVHVAGATANPDSAWVTQQTRNLAMKLADRGEPVRFLVQDREAKFSCTAASTCGLRIQSMIQRCSLRRLPGGFVGGPSSAG